MKACLIVGAGGAIGSMLRYLMSLISLDETVIFPVKTLAVNVLGAFLIGIIAALALKNADFDPKLTLFLKTGLCGGFTTFSTFALESYDLVSGGHWAMTLGYVALSVILCIAAVFAAEAIVGGI